MRSATSCFVISRIIRGLAALVLRGLDDLIKHTSVLIDGAPSIVATFRPDAAHRLGLAVFAATGLHIRAELLRLTSGRDHTGLGRQLQCRPLSVSDGYV